MYINDIITYSQAGKVFRFFSSTCISEKNVVLCCIYLSVILQNNKPEVLLRYYESTQQCRESLRHSKTFRYFLHFFISR